MQGREGGSGVVVGVAVAVTAQKTNWLLFVVVVAAAVVV